MKKIRFLLINVSPGIGFAQLFLMKICLLLAALPLFFLGQKPSLVWGKFFQLPVDAVTTTIDKGGDVIVGGFGHKEIDLDPGGSHHTLSTRGGFIVKYRTNGTFLWSKALDVELVQPLLKLVTDDEKSIVGAAVANDSGDIDPGPAVFNIPSEHHNAVIFKLDSMGEFVWVNTISCPAGVGVTDLALDHRGNVLVCGIGGDKYNPTLTFHSSNAASMDTTFNAGGYLVKMDRDGRYLWHKHCDSLISAIAVNNFGNILYIPNVVGSVEMRFVDSAGKFLSDKEIKEYMHDPQVRFDKTGNIIITGSYHNNFTIAKYDSAGSKAWLRSWTYDTSGFCTGELAIDQENSIYASGLLVTGPSLINFATAPIFDTIRRPSSFFLSLDSNGNYKYTLTFDAPPVYFPPGLDVNEKGDLFVCTWPWGPVDFDPGPSVKIAEARSVVIKLNTDQLNSIASHELDKIQLRPNPTKGSFYLNLSNCSASGEFAIRNNLGQLVYSEHLDKPCDEIQVNLKPGLYYCSWSELQKVIPLIIVEH